MHWLHKAMLPKIVCVGCTKQGCFRLCVCWLHKTRLSPPVCVLAPQARLPPPVCVGPAPVVEFDTWLAVHAQPPPPEPLASMHPSIPQRLIETKFNSHCFSLFCIVVHCSVVKRKKKKNITSNKSFGVHCAVYPQWDQTITSDHRTRLNKKYI